MLRKRPRDLRSADLNRLFRQIPKMQRRLHVLQLHREVVAIELATKDRFQIFAEAFRAINSDFKSRNVSGREKRETLDMIPMRVRNEKMQLPRFVGRQTDPQVADATARIEYNHVIPNGEGKAGRVPSVALKFRADRGRRAACAPQLDVRASGVERATKALHPRLLGHGNHRGARNRTPAEVSLHPGDEQGHRDGLVEAVKRSEQLAQIAVGFEILPAAHDDPNITRLEVRPQRAQDVEAMHLPHDAIKGDQVRQSFARKPQTFLTISGHRNLIARILQRPGHEDCAFNQTLANEDTALGRQ